MSQNFSEIIPDIKKKLSYNLNQSFDYCHESRLIEAAVIIPLLNINNQISVLFTKRSKTLTNHSNQISFPGGMKEVKDKLPINTAIREFSEELGYMINCSEIIGALKPERVITGYCIYPFIGLIDNNVQFHLNKSEVEKIISVPIVWLMNEENYSIRQYKRPGYEKHPVIFFKPFKDEVIWGITASILLNLLKLIKK